MTISSATNLIQYNGNDATSAFSTGSIIFYDDSDLVVTTTIIATGVDTTLTLTTDYTVTGGNGAAGSITLVAGVLASTKRITISRAIPYTQPDEFVEGENILAETIETRFDKATIQTQQVKEIADRALKFPGSDPTSLVATLPAAAVRASKVLAFDVDGNPTVDDTDANAAAASAVTAAASAAAASDSADDAAAAAALLPLNNYTATTAPTINDDSGDGYSVGSRWVDVTGNEAYSCVDATVGAAIWLNATLTIDELGAAALAGFLDEDSFATDSATAAASQQSIKAYIAAQITALAPFESSELSITLGSYVSATHGVTTPVNHSCYLRCKTAEHGFSVGDEVLPMDIDATPGGSSARGVESGFNATNVFATPGSSGVYVYNRTTGAPAQITNSNWRIVLRVHKL